MSRTGGLRGLTAVCAALLLGACATAAGKPGEPARAGRGASAKVFESEDFVVTFAAEGDTFQDLAARFLGDPARAWMIEDYNEARGLAPGQEVVIPKRPWSPSGVYPAGYQVVPVLVYHNIGPQAKGRLVIAARTFEQQMRYLKAEGYRVVSLGDVLEFNALARQLPSKSVMLTFDDGYRSFLEHAYPILKELGFTATLFVYTDYVGGGPNALGWDDLKKLAAEGFQIEAHSKSHSDLRRQPGESADEFARRMRAELAYPQSLLRERLGRAPRVLAYPYGAYDQDVLRSVKDQGYVAAFSLGREGSASFAHPLKLYRSQIYSDMTLEEFAKNLNVFTRESLQ